MRRDEWKVFSQGFEALNADLAGRVMLVTGASSGIGADIARAAAASGAKLVLAARRLDLLQTLADEINLAGGQAIAVHMDTTSEASTIAAYDAAENIFGRIDTIIANAGIGDRGRATEMAMEAFDHLMTVNVRGVFLTVREGAKRMIANGSTARNEGRIVIVSSVMAVATGASIAAYATSKAAVLHLGRNLARDWIRLGINVNVVLPGYIHTELNDSLFTTQAGEKFIQGFPRQRLMSSTDVIPIMLYLASDAARAVTGSVFTIDDGQTL